MKDRQRNNTTNNDKIHPINTSKCFTSILDHLICSTNLPHSPPSHNHPRRIIDGAKLPPKLINSSIPFSGSVPNSDQPIISPASTSNNTNTHHRHRHYSGSANSLDHSHSDITADSTGNSAQTHQPGLIARLMGLDSMPPNGDDASATSALNLRSRSLNSLNLFPDTLNRTSLLSRSSSSSSPQQPPADDPHRRLHHHRRVQSITTTSIPYARDYKLVDLFALTDPADCSLPSHGEEFSFHSAKQTETITGAAGEAKRSSTKTDGVISRAVTSRNDNVVIRDYKMGRPIMRRNEGCVDELKEKNMKYRKNKEVEVTAGMRKTELNKEGSNRNPCSRYGLNATSRSSSSSSKVNSDELGTGVKANHRLIKIKKKTKNKEERSNGSGGVPMIGQVGDVIATRKNSRVVHYDDDDDHPPSFVWKQSTSDLKLMNTIEQTQKSPVSVLDHQGTFEFEFFLSGSSPDSEKTGRILTFNDADVTPPRSRKGKPRRQREENEMIRSPPSPKGGRSFLVNQKNDSKSVLDKCNLTEKLDQSSSTKDFVKLWTTMCDLAAREFMKDSDWTNVGNNHGSRLTITPNKSLFDDSCVGELCADLAQGTLDVLLDQILNELVC